MIADEINDLVVVDAGGCVPSNWDLVEEEAVE